MEFCENCFEEVTTVFNVKGDMICKSCVKDVNANKANDFEEEEVAMLDNFDDMPGVMSDEDVIGMFRDEYVGY